MNHLINQLSDIEQCAVSIMDNANERKKEIAQKMADRTAVFDSQLEADTAQKLDHLRSQMETDMKATLSRQQNTAQKLLDALEDNYKTYHTAYAKELFEAMTEG